MDIDPELIATAKERPVPAETRLRFICRDVMKLRLKRRRFDVVLLLSTSKWLHLQRLGGKRSES